MLKDCQKALEDFDNICVLEPNNVFTFKKVWKCETMLDDYQKTLEDLDNVHVL